MKHSGHQNSASFGWLDTSSDQPGVIRIGDFLQYLEEWHDTGRVLLFPRRARPHSPGQVKLFEEIRAVLKGHTHIRYLP
jgi:hypothetical protein